MAPTQHFLLIQFLREISCHLAPNQNFLVIQFFLSQLDDPTGACLSIPSRTAEKRRSTHQDWKKRTINGKQVFFERPKIKRSFEGQGIYIYIVYLYSSKMRCSVLIQIVKQNGFTTMHGWQMFVVLVTSRRFLAICNWFIQNEGHHAYSW